MESTGTGVEDGVGTSEMLGQALQVEESHRANCENVRELFLKSL